FFHLSAMRMAFRSTRSWHSHLCRCKSNQGQRPLRPSRRQVVNQFMKTKIHLVSEMNDGARASARFNFPADEMHGLSRRRCFSGVRPSSGAASSAWSSAWEILRAAGKSAVSAPEDGRTPLNEGHAPEHRRPVRALPQLLIFSLLFAFVASLNQ